MKFKFKAGFAVLLVFMVFTAVFARQLAPYDPWAMDIPYLTPSFRHWLGTNDLGQDIFSELIYGTRVSLSIGFLAGIINTVFGVMTGVTAAWFGGLWDKFIVFLLNIHMSVPVLPLIIVLAAFMNKSFWNVLLCLCITGWVGTARVVRSKTMTLKSAGYVKNARTMGGGNFYIIFSHILPNMKDMIRTRTILSAASAMLTEASISYLGLTSPTMKSWGGILSDAFRAGGLFNGYWWWYIPPIFCISVTVFCFLSMKSSQPKNYLSDGQLI